MGVQKVGRAGGRAGEGWKFSTKAEGVQMV